LQGMHSQWNVVSEWQESAAHGQKQVLWRGECFNYAPGWGRLV